MVFADREHIHPSIHKSIQSTMIRVMKELQMPKSIAPAKTERSRKPHKIIFLFSSSTFFQHISVIKYKLLLICQPLYPFMSVSYSGAQFLQITITSGPVTSLSVGQTTQHRGSTLASTN